MLFILKLSNDFGIQDEVLPRNKEFPDGKSSKTTNIESNKPDEKINESPFKMNQQVIVLTILCCNSKTIVMYMQQKIIMF